MLGCWEFDAEFEAVMASVFFGHATPYSESLRMVENVGAAFFEDRTVLADCFGPVHCVCVASSYEEQFGFSFAGGVFCPVAECAGVFGHS